MKRHPFSLKVCPTLFQFQSLQKSPISVGVFMCLTFIYQQELGRILIFNEDNTTAFICKENGL